ncbi:MAG: 5'-nucleotidase C-terminal domain-containing protein [Nocardioidaceae bacterium]
MANPPDRSTTGSRSRALPSRGAFHDEPTIEAMNPGGIRADLIQNANGDVTYEAAFTTQPFNNFDVSMDLTGQQILELLEQQWSGANAAPNNKILQVSGIEYTWDQSAPAGSKVVTGSVMVDSNGDGTVDASLDPATTYRIVCNSFLSDAATTSPSSRPARTNTSAGWTSTRWWTTSTLTIPTPRSRPIGSTCSLSQARRSQAPIAEGRGRLPDLPFVPARKSADAPSPVHRFDRHLARAGSRT